MRKSNRISEAALRSAGLKEAKIYGSLVSLLYEDDENVQTDAILQDNIKNLASEKIKLLDEFAVLPAKTALVVGGTQAQLVGPAVIKALAQKGFNDYKSYSEVSKTLAEMLPGLMSAVTNKNKYEIVLIFPSYKSGDTQNSTVNVIKIFEPARCFVMIPPPVTNIKNPEDPSSKSLNKGVAPNPDFWFTIQNGQYADKREKYCKDLKQAIEQLGATAIDPRDIIKGGETQPTGITYPNMVNGVYPSPSDIQAIASAFLTEISNSTKTVPASSFIKKISPILLQKNPDIVKNFAEYPATSAVISAMISNPNNRMLTSLVKKTAPSGAAAPITSRFGWRIHPITKKEKFHQGVDIGVGVGTEIHSVLDGKVYNVGYNHKYAGHYVEIKHRAEGDPPGEYNGNMSRYVHLSEIDVEKGQVVKQGDVIGKSGGEEGLPSSGSSTGPHLHFEIWPDRFGAGDPLDPLDWLASNTDAIKPVNFA